MHSPKFSNLPWQRLLVLGLKFPARCYGKNSKIMEMGRAKENAYFLKMQQEQLRMLRKKIRAEERAITALIQANKALLRCLETKSEEECLREQIDPSDKSV